MSEGTPLVARVTRSGDLYMKHLPTLEAGPAFAFSPGSQPASKGSGMPRPRTANRTGASTKDIYGRDDRYEIDDHRSPVGE